MEEHRREEVPFSSHSVRGPHGLDVRRPCLSLLVGYFVTWRLPFSTGTLLLCHSSLSSLEADHQVQRVPGGRVEPPFLEGGVFTVSLELSCKDSCLFDLIY